MQIEFAELPQILMLQAAEAETEAMKTQIAAIKDNLFFILSISLLSAD